MKVLIVDTIENKVKVEDVEDTLTTWYEKIHCDIIDIARRKIGDKYFEFIVDDIGLFKPNHVTAANKDGEPMLVGSLVVTGEADNKGDLTALTDSDVELIKENMSAVMSVEGNEITMRPVIRCEY